MPSPMRPFWSCATHSEIHITLRICCSLQEGPQSRQAGPASAATSPPTGIQPSQAASHQPTAQEHASQRPALPQRRAPPSRPLRPHLSRM